MAIIVKMSGGLGNQMFQYAMGKSLAERNHTTLLLDTSLYQSIEMHNGFELEYVFDISVKIASKSEIKALLGWKTSKLVRKILSKKRFVFLRGLNYYHENELEYNGSILTLPSNGYLEGYWQSERYFKDIEGIIRDEFVFKKLLLGRNTEIADKIKNSNSVSLHVRRGDYMANHSIHVPCTVDYYNQAIRYVNSHLSNPVYFIFSDDIKWARESLLIDAKSYFINNNIGIDSFNDMHLKSLCDHHIIANSSFSWWGAWLNSSKDKIVIAPKGWFHNDAAAVHGILPESWFII